MPCDQALRYSVDFSTNISILQKALDAMKITYNKRGDVINIYDRTFIGPVTIETGKNGSIRADERDEKRITEIKKQYGREVLAHAAKQTGWTMQKKQQKINLNQL
jgi:hypothetical protein